MEHLMSDISVHFSFPQMFRADEVVGNLPSFDVEEAKKIANRMISQWGDQPFSFHFVRRYLKSNGNQSLEVSPTYFLGGHVRTLEDVCCDNKPDEQILVANMRARDYRRVITTQTQPPALFMFPDDAVLVEWQPDETDCEIVIPKF
ncbi:hypothetical protein DXU03_15155 [Rhizobium johnstonii]